MSETSGSEFLEEQLKKYSLSKEQGEENKKLVVEGWREHKPNEKMVRAGEERKMQLELEEYKKRSEAGEMLTEEVMNRVKKLNKLLGIRTEK